MNAGAASARGAVRPARAEDVAALAAIERAAAALFADAGMQGAFLAETTPADTLRAALAGGLLWVATDAGDRPVGFALASVLDSGPHLEELDVHPDFGRRGLGAALVAAVFDWSRAAGHGGLTLITFRDVPWNAPFYARLGFRPLAADALGADLREHLANEAARGLPTERRVVLRYDLGVSADRSVRPERPGDEAAVDAIHAAAFARRREADLVRALRREEPSYLGLVATTAAGEPVGHVAFSAVSIEGSGPPANALGLAPLAVLPAAQNRGGGSALSRAGLPACAAQGAALVFVLGHPSYYPRFGFRPAFELGFYYRRPELEDSFFVIELAPGAAAGRSGRVRYAAAFDRL